ncbi:hypothetical protein [Peribacillus glennii]|nr:hypothetical protein [Peribacillus glennii]
MLKIGNKRWNCAAKTKLTVKRILITKIQGPVQKMAAYTSLVTKRNMAPH